MDVLPWLRAQETAQLKLFDANDWIYQTWAYERHESARRRHERRRGEKRCAPSRRTLIMTGTKVC
jgi:homoserine O-acetyltransferase